MELNHHQSSQVKAQETVLLPSVLCGLGGFILGLGLWTLDLFVASSLWWQGFYQQMGFEVSRPCSLVLLFLMTLSIAWLTSLAVFSAETWLAKGVVLLWCLGVVVGASFVGACWNWLLDPTLWLVTCLWGGLSACLFVMTNRAGRAS